MVLQLSWTKSNYGIKKRIQGRRETRLQLPVIMLVADDLCFIASFVVCRENLAFLDLVDCNVKTGAG
jgi:hypothetical protein